MWFQKKEISNEISLTSMLLFAIVTQIAIEVPAVGLDRTFVKEYSQFREYKKGDRRILVAKTGQSGSFVYTSKKSRISYQTIDGKEVLIFNGEVVKDYETHGIISRGLQNNGSWNIATFLKKQRPYFSSDLKTKCSNLALTSLVKLGENFDNAVSFSADSFSSTSVKNGCSSEIAEDAAEYFDTFIFSKNKKGFQNCLTQLYTSKNIAVQGIGLNLAPYILPAIGNIVAMTDDSHSVNNIFELSCKPQSDAQKGNASIDRNSRPMKITLPENCSPEKMKRLLLHEVGGHALVSLPLDSCREERFIEQLTSLCTGFSGQLDAGFEAQVIANFQGSCKSVSTSILAANEGANTTGKIGSAQREGPGTAVVSTQLGEATTVQQAAVAAVPENIGGIKPMPLATLANEPVYTVTGRSVPEDGKPYQIVETPAIRDAFASVENDSNKFIRPLNMAFSTLDRAVAAPALASADTTVGRQQRAQLISDADKLAATRAEALAAVGASGTVAELRQAVRAELLPPSSGLAAPVLAAAPATTLAADAGSRNPAGSDALSRSGTASGKMNPSGEVGTTLASGVATNPATGAPVASGKMDATQSLAPAPLANDTLSARAPSSAGGSVGSGGSGPSSNTGQSPGSGVVRSNQNLSSSAIAVASVLGSPSVQRVEGKTYSAALELYAKDPVGFRKALEAKDVRLFFKPAGATQVIEFGSTSPKARQLIENGKALELKKN